MEIETYAFIASMGLSGLVGAAIGVHQQWKTWDNWKAQKSSSVWTFSVVVSWGSVCLLLGGGNLPIPGMGLRYYRIVFLAAILASLTARMGVWLAGDRKIQALIQAVLAAGITSLFTVFFMLSML